MDDKTSTPPGRRWVRPGRRVPGPLHFGAVVVALALLAASACLWMALGPQGPVAWGVVPAVVFTWALVLLVHQDRSAARRHVWGDEGDVPSTPVPTLTALLTSIGLGPAPTPGVTDPAQERATTVKGSSRPRMREVAVGALVVAVLTGHSWWTTLSELPRGVTFPWTLLSFTLTVTAHLVVLLTLLLSLSRADDDWARERPWTACDTRWTVAMTLLWVAGTMGLVALTVHAQTGVAGLSADVVHTAAAAAPANWEAPQSAAPSKVLWVRALPGTESADATQSADESTPSQVLPGSRGPILVGTHRITGLEAATGEEAWRWSVSTLSVLAGKDGTLALVSPDGDRLAFVMETNLRVNQSDRPVVRVLDTDTGELLWQRSVGHDERLVAMTDHVVAVGRSAISLADGSEAWRLTDGEFLAGTHASSSLVVRQGAEGVQSGDVPPSGQVRLNGVAVQSGDAPQSSVAAEGAWPVLDASFRVVDDLDGSTTRTGLGPVVAPSVPGFSTSGPWIRLHDPATGANSALDIDSGQSAALQPGIPKPLSMGSATGMTSIPVVTTAREQGSSGDAKTWGAMVMDAATGKTAPLPRGGEVDAATETGKFVTATTVVHVPRWTSPTLDMVSVDGRRLAHFSIPELRVPEPGHQWRVREAWSTSQGVFALLCMVRDGAPTTSAITGEGPVLMVALG
ncbi:hypothetical protein I6B53_00565 [Schaalia sp. 19OD2882]|uniref:hypothetical protein n=1 Tax=Schaalia sp. 19OD2882 TaxID=2794089 RepID=UPI001C1EDCA2|nr:hypothetical protein [Schaalia sp. 19OD2882]QWW19673.1 hypothetical protein I6B53_00565 [Schaalia sp. 19OD2882]